LAFDNKSPSAILEKANNLMCHNNDSGMFVTVFLALYDISSAKLTASNGGHNASLLLDPNGTSREWATSHGAALGFLEELPYEEETIDLEVGQTLFLYTDGVTEAMSPKAELFGRDRLQKLLRSKHSVGLDRICPEIEMSLSEYQEGRQYDDITMLALKRII
jgi:sigma-B regulation protein RsbU (phosphoserine phosphatase)